jgi:SAM-dependent methyltransferase
MTAIQAAREVATIHTVEFVTGQLSSPHLTILEVGCGEGHVAAALSAKGFKVTALDSDPEAKNSAKAKGASVKTADFLEFKGGPYDAILFSRSLHHLHPLKDAVDQARLLIKAGGMLLVEDFSLETPNAQSLKWYYGLSSAIKTLMGQPAPLEEMALSEPEVIDRWKKDHAHQPPLHTGQRMLEEIKRRFEVLMTERCPYFYRSLIKELEGNVNAAQAVKAAFDWESDLIVKQVIRPAGLRIAAVPISK